MKKIVKLTTLTLTASLISGIVMANENIGVINVQYLYEHHPERQAAFEKLQEKLKEPVAKLQTQEKEFIAQKEKLSKQVEFKIKALEKAAPKLTQAQIKQQQADVAAFAKKSENELKGLYEKLQSASTALNTENQQAVVATNQRLLKEIQLATTKVAQEKKYTLVLDEKAAVYAQDSKDITQNVLHVLEAEVKANKKAK